MSEYKDAVAMATRLGEISDANIIHFFLPELKEVGRGRRATNLLPHSVIQNFIRIGILKPRTWPKCHALTDKAKNLIHESRE